MLHSLWRQLTRRTSKGLCHERRRAANGRGRSFRPQLDVLEDRTLLSIIPVTSLLDSGAGSVRQAILDANSMAGDDTIDIRVTGTINLTSALPNLSTNIDIQGPGAASLTVQRSTVVGNASFRIFFVSSGATVGLSGLTIARGRIEDLTGFTPAQGGGIYNAGTLTVSNCTVADNLAYSLAYDDEGFGLFPSGTGGGIFNVGALTLSNSTISGNTANLAGGGIYSGIYSSSSTLTMSNSTLSGNTGGGIDSNYGTLTVSDSTLSGNTGRAINKYAGTLTVSNSTLSGNTGGGIFTAFATATVSNSMFAGNSVPPYIYGGGITNYGTLTVSNSTFSGNSGGVGGIQNRGTLTVSNSTFSGNSGGFGGGIANGTIGSPSGTLTVSNSTFSGNTATYSGGGIDNYSTLTVNKSTFSGNWADNGGGIYNHGSSATATVSNCTLSGNTAGANGGGIFNFHGTLTVSNSTIASNSASAAGGGINYFSVSFGTLQVRNSLVAGNTAPNGPDLYGNLGSLGHNLIGNDSGGSGFHPSDLRNIDPRLGPLQDNGGPTLTHALLPGSPALDAGDNTDAPATDQRGLSRVVAGTIDIGAFEVQLGPLAYFALSPASGTALAGTPLDIFVSALDAHGHVVTDYTGEIAFYSADPAAGLPLPYSFTLADGGVASFPGGVTFGTTGPQELYVFDTASFTVFGYALFDVL